MEMATHLLGTLALGGLRTQIQQKYLHGSEAYRRGRDMNVQSGGAISSITNGDVALMPYEDISSVPPPASAMRKPCCEGL